jgi:hypothetical protein
MDDDDDDDDDIFVRVIDFSARRQIATNWRNWSYF